MPRGLPRGSLLKEAHQGYINWNQYEGNLRRLRENARAYGKERRRSPAGQGPALLQGLAICARCGRRMTVNYHSRAKRLIPHYLCQREGIEQGHKPCQRIPGEKIDQAVSDLLLKTLNRHNLNLTVQVHEEIQRRKEEADRLRHEQVQRARYEADLAQRRYLQVDPNNRLVADVLEAEWNRGLEELTEAQRQYEEQRKRDQETLGEAAKKQIVALTRQFPKIWNDPQTLHRDRKRVLRLIIEDVTLLKDEAISLHVRFKGGATRTLDLPAPLGAAQLRKTDPQVVKQIDALLEQHTEAEAAEILNQHGLRSAIGLSFDRLKVKRIRNAYALKSRYHRLREKGLLTHREVAQLIGIDPTQINHWRKRGLLQAERANDKNDYLFGRPDAQTLEQIRKRTRSKKPERSHCLSHT